MTTVRRFVLAVTLAAASGCTPESIDTAMQEAPSSGVALFTDATDSVGLDFRHDNGLSGQYFFPEIQGPGAALFDFDRDGDLDFYLVQGRRLDVDDASAGSGGQLYRNDLSLGADGAPVVRLINVTKSSGINAREYGIGVAAADIDNDGWTDLYLTNFGDNELWRNNGDGTFTEIAAESGIDDHRWSHSAAFLDYDRDGWLDLFVTNYVEYRIANHKECPDATGTPDYCGPLAYRPAQDSLYRNLGDNRFERANAIAGIDIPASGLGVVTADFNGDGFIDIYVANDDMANQLWLNSGTGTFSDDALIRGAAVNSQGEAEASMGVDAADVDGDGDEDLFVTHLREETNTLYINDGEGYFMDRTISAGLAAPSIGHTGFGTAFVDFDNDGLPDLPVVNGAVRAVQSATGERSAFPYEQSNQLFRNSGAGFEHIDKSSPDFAVGGVGRGLAVGDVDNDGDTDLLVANDHGPAQLFLNETRNGNHWLGIRVVNATGRDMLGARVAIYLPDGSQLWRRSRSDASYLSVNDPRILAGLGESRLVDRVDVHWPDGVVESFGALAVDRYHQLVYATGSQQP